MFFIASLFIIPVVGLAAHEMGNRTASLRENVNAPGKGHAATMARTKKA